MRVSECSRTTPSRTAGWSVKILIPIFVVSFSGNIMVAATGADAVPLISAAVLLQRCINAIDAVI